MQMLSRYIIIAAFREEEEEEISGLSPMRGYTLKQYLAIFANVHTRMVFLSAHLPRPRIKNIDHLLGTCAIILIFCKL